ncbi:MAG: hypothetical protein HQL69_15760 [Magnetococcales bacterium]|nr:hypothetical protein [Magnetococcales bacterium]
MNHKNEEFWIKRNKKDEQEFHARILDGLLDQLKEMETQSKIIRFMDEQQRSEEQKIYHTHYQAVMLGLQRVGDKTLTFDQKYAIASKIQEHLNEMELL